MSPVRAILPHSPGREPWVYSQSTYLEPRRGGIPSDKYSRRKCRSSSELFFCFVCVYPGFHIGLCPHLTLGFAGVPCLKALVISLNFDALALTLKVRCIDRNKYDVLTNVSARTYFSEYTHLLSRVRRTYYRRQLQVETVARSQKGQVLLVLFEALQNAAIARH